MSNKRGTTSQTMNNNQVKIANQNIEKRTEIEKELNIQRNPKNKGKKLSITDMEMNHLNYYNEISKHNAQGKMNNPTMKEIVRITSDESCLNQLKEKEKTKDIHKLLEHLPLMRVERINYKNKEIGHMRRELGKYCLKNPYVYIDQKKGEDFANSIFQKRLKAKGNKIVNTSSNITIDKLYHRMPNSDKKNSNFFHKSINSSEIWTKKYKLGTSSTSRKLNVRSGTDEKPKINGYTSGVRNRKNLEESEKKINDAICNTEINDNRSRRIFINTKEELNESENKKNNNEDENLFKNLKNNFNQSTNDASNMTSLENSRQLGLSSKFNLNTENEGEKENIVKITVRKRMPETDKNINNNNKMMVHKNGKSDGQVGGKK